MAQVATETGSPAQFVLTPRYGFLQPNLTLRIGTIGSRSGVELILEGLVHRMCK